MREIILGGMIFILSFNARSQGSQPPGTVKVDSLLFFDRSEIANIHYLEYLHYVKKDSSESFYEKSLPDTTLVIKAFGEEERAPLYNREYFNDGKFRYFPVVGLSYLQAKNYCQWRSDAVNRLLLQNDSNNLENTSYHYRLPTIEEWMKIALLTNYDLNNVSFEEDIIAANIDKGNLKKLIKAKELKIKKKEALELLVDFYKAHPVYLVDNLAYQGGEEPLGKLLSANFLNSVRRKNEANLIYDLRGNVSEMTSIKGIAKGGNWKTSEGEISIFDNISYDTPSETIGFRCICEVVAVNEN